MPSIQREIHTIDAQGKVPGRLATQIVTLLIGKQKTGFTPHIDQGDHVQVVNASRMKIHAGKLEQKVYHHHTTFARGLRTQTLKRLVAENPSDIIRRAVSRMLPKNNQRSARLKRLVVKN